MHQLGHNITGMFTGLAAGMYLNDQHEAGLTAVGVSILGGWYGGVFPDNVEKVFGVYWIEHRTVTHWVPLWIGALVWVVSAGYPLPFMFGGEVYAAALAFVLGGLTHLLFDWPNPTGIPVLHPWGRHSLNWWKSGEADLLCVLVWGSASLGYAVWS